MKLILLGAPGAGKGTQSEAICKKLNIPAISTGNIIREALKTGTEMGLKAKAYIDAGELVPDEVVIGIIKEELVKDKCKNGYILDGFPRTIPQAEALDRMGADIDYALSIEVPDEAIVERMSGRTVCPKCGNSYHNLYKKPAVDGICNDCGTELIVRNDDKPETVKERLNVYHKQTEPLKDYYKEAGKLLTVEGVGTVSEITERIFKTLGI